MRCVQWQCTNCYQQFQYRRSCEGLSSVMFGIKVIFKIGGKSLNPE